MKVWGYVFAIVLQLCEEEAQDIPLAENEGKEHQSDCLQIFMQTLQGFLHNIQRKNSAELYSIGFSSPVLFFHKCIQQIGNLAIVIIY